MSLGYMIDRVCEYLGYDPVNDRDFVVSMVNRAGREIYEKTDIPGCLREMTVQALSDNHIALPQDIGELRGAKSHYSLQRLDLREMAARYAFNNWPQITNNWAVIKKSPLKQSIENATVPIVVSLGEVCTEDITVTVVGSTQLAKKVTEILLIEAGEDETQLSNAFVDIISINKDIITNANITFTGRNEANTADIELSVLENDKFCVLYTLVDVSKLPFGGDQGTQFRYIDVLFKCQYYDLVENGEEFICPGMDDVIVAKVCEYKYSQEEGGGEKALGFYQKANQLLSQKIENTNGATDKMLVFAPSPYLGLFPRGRGRRYGWWMYQ